MAEAGAGRTERTGERQAPPQFAMDKDRYDSLIQSIFRRFPSVQTSAFKDAYKPGLQHMKDFNAELGNPCSAYRTVHVAGTNGKGSVANMLASVLLGAGLKVGLYTSPHILDFRERMRIADGRGDGKVPAPRLVPREYVYDFLQKWSDTFDRLSLSFFEITTGMAFKWFVDEGVDIAVIETGLGGRLDSTNIIVPELSIVTSIGLDHCEQLGDTLEKIAAEKAGIFKPGVPAVVGETLPETEPVFRRCFGDRCGLTFADKTEPPFWENSEKILSEMDLRGVYQEANLRTVLTSTDVLRGLWKDSGDSRFREAAAHIQDGRTLIPSIVHTASAMDFHGRWERLSTNPDVLCDIAHNAAALKYNFAQLEDLLDSGKYTSLIIVYGVMADKNLDEIMPLFPENATFIFTTPDTARALPAEDIMSRYKSFCKSSGRASNRLYVMNPVRDALAAALRTAAAYGGNPLIYIGGSTFVVAAAVPYF